MRNDFAIRVEERLKVHGEITNDWQVAERFNLQTGPNVFDQRAASEPLAPIYYDGARAAHANPARKLEGQIWRGAALQREERVENTGFVGEIQFVSFGQWRGG